jgi:vitamin B12 transporter
MLPLSSPFRASALALTALSCVLHSSQGTAQSVQSVTGRPDDVIVVTGARSPQRADQALADVTVIDRAALDAATGRSLTEVLANHAGIQAWSTGGLGKSAAVSIRGLESRHTLLLIDGVRYGSATLGTPSWENLPLDAIERIEVVRGPLSGLYGTDAVGGVVQIFLRRGREGWWPDAVAGIGSAGYGQAGAGLRFGQGAWDGALRLQHQRNKGFSASNARLPFGNFNEDKDGFSQSSVQAQLGLKLAAWRAEASLLKSSGRTGFDDGPGVDARSAVRTQLAALNLAGPVMPAWRTTLRVARSVDESQTLATASPFTDLGTYGTTQDQLSWENQVSTPLGQVLALAERVNQKVEKPAAAYEVSSRQLTGLGMGLNGAAGVHSWQVNARRDSNSQFGSRTTGTAAYGMDLVPGLRASVSWGTSFVVPSFNQLYFPSFGNPLLQPEEGRQQEVSLRWTRAGTHSQTSARVSYSEHRIHGYISSGAQPTNIPRTRVDGISAQLDTRFGAWTFDGALDVLNPVNDTQGSANFGKLLPRRAQELARVGVNWQQGAYQLGGQLNAAGIRFEDAANTQALAGYATLDLRADWQVAREWSLGFKLNNVGNQRYETALGYNQPGREAYLTLRWAAR